MNNQDIEISFKTNFEYTDEEIEQDDIHIPIDQNYKGEYWLETCFECKQKIPVAENKFYKGHRAHNACILLHTGTSTRKNIKGLFN